MNTHAVMDHKAAFARLDEGLRLALQQAEGDPAMLAWLIGATLVGLGQQGYLDKRVTAIVAEKDSLCSKIHCMTKKRGKPWRP